MTCQARTAFIEEKKKMSYKNRILGQTIYNPVSKHASPGGMKQYLVSSTDELAGRTLTVWLDGLSPVCLHFWDGENLSWGHPGEALHWEPYEAAKADEELFLIKFLLTGRQPVTHATLVWDAQTTLVTCVMATLGANPDRPRLVNSRVYFGAQKLPHIPPETARHGYTEELVNKRIIWRYNPNDEVMHIYGGKNYLRLGHSDKTLADDASEEERRHYQMFLKRRDIYPEYEEPAYYIKLKEGFYLYSVTERNVNRVLPKQGGNQLLILLNAHRVRYIGRVFGYRGDGSLENDFIGAIGRFSGEPDEVEGLPYPLYLPDDGE